MRDLDKIKGIEIKLDPKIKKGNIDRIRATIIYTINRKQKTTTVTTLYCTNQHEYSLLSILRKAGLLKGKGTPIVAKIEIKHVRTFGTAIPRNNE